MKSARESPLASTHTCALMQGANRERAMESASKRLKETARQQLAERPSNSSSSNQAVSSQQSEIGKVTRAASLASLASLSERRGQQVAAAKQCAFALAFCVLRV